MFETATGITPENADIAGPPTHYETVRLGVHVEDIVVWSNKEVSIGEAPKHLLPVPLVIPPRRKSVLDSLHELSGFAPKAPVTGKGAPRG